MSDPERRDFHRRAEMTRHALARILAGCRAISPADLSDVIPEAAAERMLKRFAVRGLLRRCSDGWMPQPVLFRPAALEPAEAV